MKDQLREMFQMDRGDLDFGIYRIMNQKRDEISRFLDEQLLPQVHDIMEEYQPISATKIQEELDKTLANLKDAGVDPEGAPKVKELRAKLSETVDINKLENEIYSDLYNFFKRYYSEGDFMSMRRYKEGVYALPYEGEEVKLYWANNDQYYIKTTEDLKHYSFKTVGGKKRVRFEVVAGSTETNNNKAAEEKKRRFILHADAPVKANGEELTICFEFRSDDFKRKQDDLNKETVEAIFNLAEATTFGLKDKAPTEKNPDRTLLEKHLTIYTAKNTFDYFIHKDLGKFLRQELDFYIKNEIMHLDDIENETAPKVENYLAKVKAMRKVDGKIIQFLAQLEDFQKKLWLKKKFVLETNYCITLDHIISSNIADKLLPIIAGNDAQRQEWVKLFAINELKGDLASAGYSIPLTIDFLKGNDKLLVDTKFFDTNFKYALLSVFDDLDEQINGILINSENFQALNLLQERYKEKVKCVYIDPPYNTGKDDFLYKDNYQSSSWITMMATRLTLAHNLLNHEAIHLSSISDKELGSLTALKKSIFGDKETLATFVWINDGNIDNQSKVKINHDYIVAFCKEERTFPRPLVIAPEIGEESKLYNDTIENSITKNGPANPPSVVTLPAGFPASFESGNINKRENKWPHLLDNVQVSSGKIISDVRAYSGWSSRSLLDAFIANNCMPIRDSNGLITSFKITSTGAIYDYKKRENQSHVLSVIRNVGTVKKTSIYLSNMGLSGISYPKPMELIKYLCSFSNDVKGVILDYFAGSGTTGHAVINLNREDGGSRKYILVEMGEYFDSVTKPRILKAAYSNEWKDGKPVTRDGVSQIIKYMTLEQYEDTLDNLGLSRSETQAALLKSNPQLNEQYMLGYMLDVESRGSQSLLNIDAFVDPFAYNMRITRNDDTQVVNVDLVETFNYLIGLTVRTIGRDDSGIVTVTGKNSLGENCLIIWRNVNEIDNTKLDTWFGKCYPSKDFDFDAIYVNGDNNLENMKRADDQWKVRLIEAEFKRLMFDVQDV